MRKSGVLRRVIIILAFAWGYSHIVISDSQYVQDPQKREYLRWLLYGASGYGIVTLFADRFQGTRRNNDKEEPHDE